MSLILGGIALVLSKYVFKLSWPISILIGIGVWLLLGAIGVVIGG